jgi:hypothetical protein
LSKHIDMLSLQSREFLSELLLSDKFLEFVVSVENWSEHFLSPPWSVSLFTLSIELGKPLVWNNLLVVKISWEVPDFFLISTMINHWLVGSQWVSVRVLTSHTADWWLFVIILVSNKVSLSLDNFAIRLERLSSFKFITLSHVNIVVVSVMVWVLQDVFVPSDEGVV